MQKYKIILHFINQFPNFVRHFLGKIFKVKIMGSIIKKIFTFLLLPAAIVLLVWLNVDSIAKPVRYENDKSAREAVAIQRMKDIRTLQEAYKNVYSRYSPTIDSLKLFYNEGKMKVVLQVGSPDDSLMNVHTAEVTKRLKARGVKAKDIPEQLHQLYEAGDRNLWFAIEHEMPIKDTLFTDRSDFCVDSLAFIPFSGGDSIYMKAEVRELQAVRVPLFEARAPYKSLLKGLDPQLVVNTIAGKEDLDLYPGLKVGDLEKPNNNAGNWE